jgi:hypothetical protein
MRVCHTSATLALLTAENTSGPNRGLLRFPETGTPTGLLTAVLAGPNFTT